MFYVIALIVIVLAGMLLVVIPGKKSVETEHNKSEETTPQVASDCCGAHEICEFDEAKFNPEIIEYFEDEDLDVLRNVREDQITAKHVDDLRDVLYTLRADEIGKWLTSLSRRHIHLPQILHQEARQLMAEK
jgi:hypothetical protein